MADEEQMNDLIANMVNNIQTETNDKRTKHHKEADEQTEARDYEYEEKDDEY